MRELSIGQSVQFHLKSVTRCGRIEAFKDDGSPYVRTDGGDLFDVETDEIVRAAEPDAPTPGGREEELDYLRKRLKKVQARLRDAHKQIDRINAKAATPFYPFGPIMTASEGVTFKPADPIPFDSIPPGATFRIEYVAPARS
jgi:hypothetical protein